MCHRGFSVVSIVIGTTFILVLYLAVSTALALLATPDEQSLFNERFSDFLKGQVVAVEVAEKGMQIPLNSVVTTGPIRVQSPGEKRVEDSVTMSFRLHDIEPQVLSSLSEGKTISPFTSTGVETVITQKCLHLRVHQGTAIHLRNDLPGLAAARPFKSESVVGVVTEVHGRVLVLRDREIVKDRFFKLLTLTSISDIPCIIGQNCVVEPDGSISIRFGTRAEDREYIPRSYPLSLDKTTIQQPCE